MAAMSSLRMFGGVLCPLLRSPFAVSSGRLSVPNASVNKALVRQMGSHKRTIPMLPSSFEWRKWKDQAHFYTLLGVIPIAILVGAVNLFIGPAELADIPEDYEPKHWEYYRHPISRFISRYISEPQEKLYERHLHFVSKEMDKIQLRKLEDKVKHLIDAPTYRYDSKKWYYVKPYEKATFAGRRTVEENAVTTGFKD